MSKFNESFHGYAHSGTLVVHLKQYTMLGLLTCVTSSVSDNLLLKYANTEVTHTGHHMHLREIIFLVIVNSIFVAGTTIALTSVLNNVSLEMRNITKSIIF